MFLRPGVVTICLIALASPSAPLAAQQAERRWIVDNSVATSGDGSPSSPFQTLAEAATASRAGDTIAVSATDRPYAGGISLKDGQSLIGEGGTPLIAAGDGDAIAVADSSAAITIANLLVRATGNANAVHLRNARGPVTLSGMSISTAGGIGLLVTSATKLSVGTSTVESVDAPAISIEAAELDVTFASVSARGDRLAQGITLRNTTGRFAVEGGTIEGASTRAISAIGATNVSLKAMKLLRSASTNGVAPSDCGGDLIAGTNERCNGAVFLQNVDGVTLEGVAIEGSGQAGVVAHEVRNLAIVDSTIRNAGDELYEHGIVLEELTGACRIAGTTIERSASRHLMLHNSGGQLAMVIERARFSETGTPHGQQAVLVTAADDASIDLRIRDSAFTRAFGNALEVNAADHTKVEVRVTGSKFHRNASAIALAATQSASLDYVIADNPSLTGSENAAINVYLGTPSSGTLSGTIARNVIGTSGVPKSGAACSSCSGIVLSANGRGSLIADVSGNIVQQVGASAIHATASQGGAQLQLTATANLLREGGSSAPAIRVQSGALAEDTTHVCADLGGAGVKANTIEGTWEPNGAIHLVHRFGGTRFQLAGLAQGKSDEAAATAVAARNGGVKVRAVLRPDSMEKGFEPAERCTMPALTP